MQMIYNELGITSNEIFLNSVMLENVDVYDEPGALTYTSLALDAGSVITRAKFSLENVFSSPVAQRTTALNKVLGVVGKAAGIIDVYQHGYEAYNHFVRGNTADGLLSVGKTLVDIGFVVYKGSNPVVLGGSVLWGVYNTYEDLSSTYK
jgi:hypothetical protein